MSDHPRLMRQHHLPRTMRQDTVPSVHYIQPLTYPNTSSGRGLEGAKRGLNIGQTL